MLRVRSPILRGPTPSQQQGLTKMNKQPLLIRPLAQSQCPYQGMRTLLQWPVSQTYGVLRANGKSIEMPR
ncbi:hypothetical protein H5410_027803 [Solanum commersonii]|uniref:Uncharacterized protein n=1 Tax=Solanum commersonii TaxID=4109 RepID=A0A9J5Z343_SOLCO|nr:hypothetical protein H5410_027803 [Solanum commersonii]